MVTGPRKPKSMSMCAARDLECQFAMHAQFELLTGLAERLGWRWDEIALALLELTDEYVSAKRPGLVPSTSPRSCAATVKTRH